MIAEPPVPFGTTEIVAELRPRVMVSIDGAEGTFAGITATDGREVSEMPTPFTAVTTNVYEVPLVRLLKMIGEEDPEAVAPLDAVTV